MSGFLPVIIILTLIVFIMSLMKKKKTSKLGFIANFHNNAFVCFRAWRMSIVPVSNSL